MSGTNRRAPVFKSPTCPVSPFLSPASRRFVKRWPHGGLMELIRNPFCVRRPSLIFFFASGRTTRSSFHCGPPPNFGNIGRELTLQRLAGLAVEGCRVVDLERALAPPITWGWNGIAGSRVRGGNSGCGAGVVASSPSGHTHPLPHTHPKPLRRVPTSRLYLLIFPVCVIMYVYVFFFFAFWLYPPENLGHLLKRWDDAGRRRGGGLLPKFCPAAGGVYISPPVAALGQTMRLRGGGQRGNHNPGGNCSGCQPVTLQYDASKIHNLRSAVGISPGDPIPEPLKGQALPSSQDAPASQPLAHLHNLNTLCNPESDFD